MSRTLIGHGFRILALALTLWATGPAAADEPPVWQIVEVSGEILIRSADGRVTPASTTMQVREGDVVSTVGNGRAVLVRNDETIIVAPGSEVAIPKQDPGWGTVILQNLGSSLFKVHKGPNPHFKVVTPFLAAIVKGTTFAVSVESAASVVHVVEGGVQVELSDAVQTPGPRSVLVRPGQTVTFEANASGGLMLDGKPVDGGASTGTTDTATTTAAANETESGTTGTAGATTTVGAQSVVETAATQASAESSATGSVATDTTSSASAQAGGFQISGPVGLASLDFGKLTGGLVHGPSSGRGGNADAGGRGRSSATALASATPESSNGLGSVNGRSPVAAVRAAGNVEVSRGSDGRLGLRDRPQVVASAASSGNGNSGGNGNGNGGNGGGNSGGNGNGNSGGNGGGNSGGNGNGNSGGNGGGNSGGGNSGGNGNGKNK